MRWILILLGAGLAACSSAPTRRAPPVPARAELLEGATLGIGDVIEVRVYQEKELSDVYRVDTDGSFDFPLVGRIQAAGLNAGRLAEVLAEKLRAGFLRSPQVTVFVKEFNSKKVFVLGQVAKPGTFKYEDNMTIVQAITLAGGLKPLAAGNSVVLTRVDAGVEKRFTVPVEEIGRGEQENVVLQPGDIVFVPETWL